MTNIPGDITFRDIVAYKTRGFCFYCGAGLVPYHNQETLGYPPERMVVEHMQPVSRGGTDELNNLIASCPQCNHQKASLTVHEYRIFMAIRAARFHEEVGRISQFTLKWLVKAGFDAQNLPYHVFWAENDWPFIDGWKPVVIPDSPQLFLPGSQAQP